MEGSEMEMKKTAKIVFGAMHQASENTTPDYFYSQFFQGHKKYGISFDDFFVSIKHFIDTMKSAAERAVSLFESRKRAYELHGSNYGGPPPSYEPLKTIDYSEGMAQYPEEITVVTCDNLLYYLSVAIKMTKEAVERGEISISSRLIEARRKGQHLKQARNKNQDIAPAALLDIFNDSYRDSFDEFMAIVECDDFPYPLKPLVSDGRWVGLKEVIIVFYSLLSKKGVLKDVDKVVYTELFSNHFTGLNPDALSKKGSAGKRSLAYEGYLNEKIDKLLSTLSYTK